MKPNTRTKKLGSAQIGCLENLGRGWSWRYGWRNSWVWDTAAGTRKILDSLVSCGFAICVNGEYSITVTGKAHLTELTALKSTNTTDA